MDFDLMNLAVQIAMVVGLNEAVKQLILAKDDNRYIPLISVVMGVAVCLLLFPVESLQLSLRDGVIAGLSAVGLFTVADRTKARE